MDEQKGMNRMGTEPVKKLLLSMGIPMILSMMMQALYNIVDSAFVSNIKKTGEAAQNALTLAFPVQMLMVAVGIGTGVGMNALVAKSLGQKKLKRASYAAGNAIFLGIIIYLLFFLFGIFGAEAYIRTQTNNREIIEMAVDYLRICCTLSMGIVFFSVFEKLLQATGRSLYSTIAQVSGAVVNMILDPILIYGYLGLPEMKVRGAAYATVIGQIVSVVLAIIFHIRYNKEIENRLSYLKPSGKLIAQIYVIGFPAIIAQALMSIMTYSLNIIFVKIDESVVTAYGLYYKIQQFILFAAFGLRDAITPIVSFNHGLRSKKRIQQGIRYGMLYTLIIMLVGMLVLEVFAHPISTIFGLSSGTQTLCIQAMRLASLSFLFAGVNIAYQGIFQALNGGIESLVISLLRQCIFVLPLAWGFTKIALQMPDYTWLIWLSFLIAEGLSALVSVLLMRGIKKREIYELQ